MAHPCETARRFPDKPAIIMAGTGEVVTYRELDERSNQGAQLFRSLGLKKGDHIAMLLENRREFLEICWAAQRAGLIYTPISIHLKADEAAYIAGNCGASLLIVSSALEDLARAVLAKVALTHCLMIGGTREGFIGWHEALAVQPASPIADQANGVPMLYSSGTTGTPKGVFIPPVSDDMHQPHRLASSFGVAFGFGEQTVYLSPAPLYHAAPLQANLLVHYFGGTSVIMEKFDPERALALIETHRITHSQWVPIMFVRMLKLPAATRARYDLGSLKVAIHAAAPCPVEIKQQMIDWWGPVLIEYYAASEGVGATFIDSVAWLQHRGSVGRAIVGTAHIVDDDGRELSAGEVGTVYFSGPQTTFAYHNEASKTAEAYDRRGWATVGDIGYLDGEGYLYLTDRKHFTIISGGVNIYPQEVENLLITHEKVADVAVIGVPSPEYGEEVKAFVQPSDPEEAGDELAAELIAWLRERLSHIKVPRSIEFRAELPRLDNGKLYKRRLVDEARSAAQNTL